VQIYLDHLSGLFQEKERWGFYVEFRAKTGAKHHGQCKPTIFIRLRRQFAMIIFHIRSLSIADDGI